MKTGGKIYNSFEIELDDNENEIISVPQIGKKVDLTFIRMDTSAKEQA